MDDTTTNDNTAGPASGEAKTRTRKKPASRRAAPAGGKRAPARKKTAPAAATATAKSPSRKKKAGSLEGLLRDFSRRASKAGSSIATISGEGLGSAKKAIGQAGAASKSTIDRLTREWKKMDGKKRAQFAAALLGALAAASAPIVRSSFKKK
jgi:hypothetical protein